MNIPGIEIEEAIQRWTREEEDRLAFSDAVMSGKVVDAVLIMHPEHKWIEGILLDKGVSVTILWSNLAPRDRFLMVTDKEAARNIKEAVNDLSNSRGY